MRGEIYQASDEVDFSRCAGQLIVAAGREAVRHRGRFVVALTGGHTVQPVYRYLAGSADVELRSLLGGRTDYFWGDERLVAPAHPDSNFGLARRLLFDVLAVLPKHLHPVLTDMGDPVAAAQLWEGQLRGFFAGGSLAAGFPVFDLILLGLGPDGHVVSLFPGSEALMEEKRWVRAVPNPGLAPQVARVTLTLPVLNQARLVLVLVHGLERCRLAQRIMAGEEGTTELPAARLLPAGRLFWLLSSSG